MKFIIEKDDVWHPFESERPPSTTEVDLLDLNGNIIKGKIVVEMSGYYIYLDSGWKSLEDYTHWRFRQQIKERNNYGKV